MKKKEREIALEILQERSENQYIKTLYTEKMQVYNYLNNVQKAFIKRLVHGVVEREYTLDYIIRANSSLRLKKIHPIVLDILRISVYQILYMDKIPDYSIVNEAVNLVKRNKQFRATGFTNAVLHQIIEKQDQMLLEIDAQKKKKNWKVAYSFPEDLINLLLADYNEEIVKKIMEQSLEDKPLNLRFVYTKREARLELEAFLANNKVHVVGEGMLFKNCCKYYGNIEAEPAFKKGYLQVQDEASMLVGYLAAQDHPKLIYDLCASPGGKSVHMAELLPQSKIVASDLNKEKLEKIKENIERLGINNIELTIQDGQIFDLRKQEQADCVVVDAPCSGIGVISGKPDIKYRVNAETIEELNQIQANILEQAAQYVKKGGTLFYSTCTITSAENQNMIQSFIKKHPEFEICQLSMDDVFNSEVAKEMMEKGEIVWRNQMLQILSSNLQGFFIAKLRKTL